MTAFLSGLVELFKSVLPDLRKALLIAFGYKGHETMAKKQQAEEDVRALKISSANAQRNAALDDDAARSKLRARNQRRRPAR